MIKWDGKYSAFTVKEKGIVRRLMTRAKISGPNHFQEVTAQWDTGASFTAIARELVKSLDLKPIGFTTVLSPTGSKELRKFYVDIELPSGVTVRSVEVAESDIGAQGIGVLIGMDIIAQGSFSISNYEGKTTFSFIVPPASPLDYVQKINAQNQIKQSGKKRR